MKAVDENQRLVAILRGITLDEVNPLVGALIDSGFAAIEIPLNSPTPFKSIARAVELSRQHGGPDRLIGAGTVLTAEDVDRVKAVATAHRTTQPVCCEIKTSCYTPNTLESSLSKIPRGLSMNTTVVSK